ncbi:MAG: LysM peptidoglycan-binding domain-containing protein [Prosthecobacter sp.]
MTAHRFLALSAACLALASCENMKKSGSSDPYASNYGNDGHYNPYPGQTGYASSSTPTYQKPPAPEPPPDPYAFSTPKTTPSTSSSSSTPKKTTSSSSSTAKKSTSTTKKSSSGSRYTIVKGDTLYGIARKKGTTVAKLKSANGLKSDLIRPGQVLKIP